MRSGVGELRGRLVLAVQDEDHRVVLDAEGGVTISEEHAGASFHLPRGRDLRECGSCAQVLNEPT